MIDERPGIVQRFALNQLVLQQVRDSLAVGDERDALNLMRGFFGLPNGQVDSPVGYVYVVRSEELDRYKIGFSISDPKYRVAALQTGCPTQLTLVAAIPNCSPAIERELHRRFEPSRLHGEWFSGTPELMAFIEAHR